MTQWLIHFDVMYYAYDGVLEASVYPSSVFFWLLEISDLTKNAAGGFARRSQKAFILPLSDAGRDGVDLALGGDISTPLRAKVETANFLHDTNKPRSMQKTQGTKPEDDNTVQHTGVWIQSEMTQLSRNTLKILKAS